MCFCTLVMSGENGIEEMNFFNSKKWMMRGLYVASVLGSSYLTYNIGYKKGNVDARFKIQETSKIKQLLPLRMARNNNTVRIVYNRNHDGSENESFKKSKVFYNVAANFIDFLQRYLGDKSFDNHSPSVDQGYAASIIITPFQFQGLNMKDSDKTYVVDEKDLRYLESLLSDLHYIEE